MERNYPILGKITIALFLALLAIYLPFIPVKILLTGAAGILFALCFKKFKVLLIIFFVLMLITMGGVYVVLEFFDHAQTPWFLDNLGQINFGGHFGMSSTLILPDSEEAIMENLTIRGNSLKVNFIEGIDTIKFASPMKAIRDETDGTLILDGRSAHSNRTLVIEIPADFDFSEIAIDVDAMSIGGAVRSKSFTINADALNMDGTYIVERLRVDTNAANVKATLNGGEFVFFSEAMNLSAQAKRLDYFEVKSQVLNGKLRFTENWDGERNVDLEGTIGRFSIETPKDPNSKLYVDSRGELFNVSLDSY